MPAGGILGDGVKLAYSAASPQSWIELTQLLDLPKPPSPTPDRLENTTHGTSGFHTFGLGLKEVPDVEAVLLFDPDVAAHMAMILARDNKTEYWFRVEVPTNAAKTLFIAWEFQGKVMTADITTPIPDWQNLNLAIIYTGGYTYQSTAMATEIT